MKRFRVMAAALCAAVLLCGFSVPAYAMRTAARRGLWRSHHDRGNPGPGAGATIEPGEGFSEEATL